MVALALLTVVWTWWACKQGAYFGVVMYPGVALLCAGLLLIAPGRPWSPRLELSIPVRVGLWALLALGIWSALSALWSPSPDIALADAQRILGYGLAFALGIWLCTLLGKRIHLAMAPLALAGLLAGILAIAGLLTGDQVGTYLDKGTLEYPIGYRNANAAFFLIALWPAVGLAATRELDWRLRALALGAASLCLELAMLSQSRGSTIAAAVALVVYLGVSRDRARAITWLALAVAPALVVLPALTDLYQSARELAPGESIDELHAAGRAALGGLILAIAIGGIAALVGRRFPASAKRRARANQAVAIGAIALALAGMASFVITTGDPIEWVNERAEEFRSQGTPDSSDSSSRFGLNAGSERYDLWRVALRDARAEPLLGDGGGGYHYSYIRQRGEGGIESVRDAHSVELELLSELGIPGLLLFLLAIIGAVAGALRARGVSPSAAALSTCALTAGGYWLAHASIDWFWTYPAVTAPVFALLGSASAPALLTRMVPPSGSGRRPAAAGAVIGAVVLAVSVVPPYLSERYVNNAFSDWRADPTRAEQDLDRARTLNPLSDLPLLAEGAIAREGGERERAIAAFEDAVELRPEEWAAHYFLATLHRRSSPRQARAELEIAAGLNPLSDRIDSLRERLEASSPRGEGGA
jgi:hypothetical protein